MASLSSCRVKIDVEALNLEETAPANPNGHMRKSRGRVPTPIVSSDLLASVQASPGADEHPASGSVRFCEEVSAEVVSCPPAVRSLRERVPTPPVPLTALEDAAGAARPQVRASAAPSVEEVETPCSALMGTSRGRPPTPRASGEGAHAMPGSGTETEGGPCSTERERAEEATGRGLVCSLKGGTPRGHMHDNIDDQAGVSQAVSASSTSTGEGSIRFAREAEVEEAASDACVGPERSVRGRIPTGYIRKNSEAQKEDSSPTATTSSHGGTPGLRFANEVSMVASVATPSTMRSVKNRTPTPKRKP